MEHYVTNQHQKTFNKDATSNAVTTLSKKNEEYHNDPFPIKRICLLSKEQGHKAKVTFNEQLGEIDIDKSESAIAFVPPCTKNVFIKAYTDLPDSLSAWTEKDAEAYKKKIREVLHDFLS